MHSFYLQKTLDLACDNVTAGGGPFAALVVRKGQIVATGSNRVTSSLDPTAHAEVVAIRAACQQLADFQLTDCVLYSSCEPCPMCLGAIYWARLSAVYFASSRFDAAAAGFDDEFIYAEIPKPTAERQIAMRQIVMTDATQPFIRWNTLTSRIRY